MNPEQEISIPLAGPGYVEKSSYSFGPGEYKDFTNLIITPEGTIKKRPPIQGAGMSNTDPSTQKIIGYWGSDVVFAEYNYTTNEPRIFRTSRTGNGTQEGTFMAAILSALPAGLKTNIDTQTGYADTRSYLIEGFFQYNNSSYALIVATNRFTTGTTVIYRRRTFIVKGSFNAENPNSSTTYVMEATATPVEAVDWSLTYNDNNFRAIPAYPIVSHFVHKERVVVATSDTVYLSKATDPSKFLVADDGAFFKFPGKVIKKVVSIKDLIYVIFETSISVITYNTSPNIDSSVKAISEGIGGEDASVYGDSIYVLNAKGIYAITGTNMQKIIDLQYLFKDAPKYVTPALSTDLALGESPSFKIEAWNDALYFYSRALKFANSSLASIYHCHPVHKGAGAMFRMDLNNGHISRFTFGRGGATGSPIITVSDSYPSRPSSRNANDRFYLLSKNETLTWGELFFFSKSPMFNSNVTNGNENVFDYGMDSYSSWDGIQNVGVTIPVSMVIANFAPGDLKYLYRKFRSISIMADLPTYLIEGNVQPELELVLSAGVAALMDGTKPFVRTALVSEPIEVTQPSREVTSYRYAINQRARDLSITIKTSDAVKNTYFLAQDNILNSPGGIYTGAQRLKSSLFELVDISLVWTDTRRGPSTSPRERA